jgi:CheY-like chemotaxis protein
VRKMARPTTILMADDDLDDCLFAREALKESHVRKTLYLVHDGEQLLDYLTHRGKYADLGLSPRPDLILLDLNMPRMEGREALKAIKEIPSLRRIPVVVLTKSNSPDDISAAYSTGANSYITKAVTFDGLVSVMKTMKRYWFEIVELPSGDSDGI